MVQKQNTTLNVLKPGIFLKHYREIISFSKLLLFGQCSIKENEWYNEIMKTRINRGTPLFIDRQREIKDFFGVNNLFLLRFYLKNGFPNSQRFRRKMISLFEGKLAKSQLKKAYENASFVYTVRLLLAYEKYSLMAKYLDFLIKKSGKDIKEFEILDYGCGVSDFGILLASLGANVTICDLDDKKLEFTMNRFKTRHLKFKVIRVNDTEKLQDLPKSRFDLIIASEIFEHVRSPLKLLKSFTTSLKKNGYLFDSMGGKFEREIGGDHLPEAIEIGNSSAFRNYYKKNYKQLKFGNLDDLFRKND